MLQLCDLLQNNEAGQPQKAARFSVYVLLPYEHVICFQTSWAVWSGGQIDSCRNEPQESAWSWTPFSAFSFRNLKAFAQDERSRTLLPSVRRPIIARRRLNANEMCICWDYLHDRPLWHVQLTITRKNLDFSIQNTESENFRLSQESVLQHKCNHSL